MFSTFAIVITLLLLMFFCLSRLFSVDISTDYGDISRTIIR